MNGTKKITRTEVHAAWCDQHGEDDTTCGTENPELVIDIDRGLSVWPTFDDEEQQTRITLDTGFGRTLTLDEAVKLSDALFKVRARLLGLGDDPRTRAVVEAYRLGYAAGKGDAQSA